MHVVAIHNLAADKEKPAPALAAVLGTTVFEALSRLRALGSGPLVVGVFGEKEQAGLRTVVVLNTNGDACVIVC